MTAEGIRDTWTLNRGPLRVYRTGDWVEVGVDLTGMLNAMPQVEPASNFTVHQKHGSVTPVASVARESYNDQWPLTTPGTAFLAEAGPERAARSMEAMQCPSIEGNS